MNDDTGGNVVDLQRPKLPKQFSIEAILKGPASPEPVPPPAPAPEAVPEAAGIEAADTLPLPGSAYQACSRVANKPQITLHFLLANQSREGFAYADLRRIRLLPAADPGSGPELVLRFVEAEITDVRLIGRNLDMLYELLGRHAVGWVRQLPPKWDFSPKEAKAVVITGIEITTPKK
ncbi:hypothetical protein [Singulisphaera acidiphila]|uniref:Uncharacterized protein n=1 Tax=Singulisphaera acidiphila (strain ATCC BAA-1392 / DSM 18658 / VKM B-2454 / MOB10) TaxID=886293 RepID=L0DRS5_SINAD|nr:hypothetical protein [Singulisphaera acidiphila]AGA31713.1 hypothetical protein Sinac_7685 [Singulisphaera acidiphila DSM 18658]